jgi:uncharacterized membrane protein YfcA
MNISDLLALAGLFFAAMAAGAINSIAGGGSLISFPALVAYGLTHNISEKLANATNNAGLVPGSVAGVAGFWDEVKRSRKLVAFMAIPSIVGGLLGAFLLARTPEEIFRRIVPFLILFATLLFAGRDRVNGLTRRGASEADQITMAGGIIGFVFQLVIATYGGYFGAGQSLMMMAAFSIMGLRDIHEINGLKTASAVMVNSVALIFFATQGLIVWNVGLWMACGAIVGGYFAARISKRIHPQYLRWTVIIVGLIVSAILFIRSI